MTFNLSTETIIEYRGCIPTVEASRSVSRCLSHYNRVFSFVFLALSILNPNMLALCFFVVVICAHEQCTAKKKKSIRSVRTVIPENKKGAFQISLTNKCAIHCNLLSFGCSLIFFFADSTLLHFSSNNVLFLSSEMFNVFVVLMNCPLLSLLPDLQQTPLERSFCAWLHKGWRETNGRGPFVNTTTTRARPPLRRDRGVPQTHAWRTGETQHIFFQKQCHDLYTCHQITHASQHIVGIV